MYSLTSAAVIVAMCQMRKLEQDSSHTLELDNLLLVIAQTGVFIYAAFSIIATFFQVYLKAGWEMENWEWIGQVHTKLNLFKAFDMTIKYLVENKS